MSPSLWTFGRAPVAPLPPDDDTPDWAQCRPGWIDRALARALERPAGGWFVLDGARAIGATPRTFQLAGRTLVAWRTPQGALRVGPDECPHMGASLSQGRVDRAGCVVCPWHGLALGERPHGRWRPLPAVDDGVLAWVRLSRDEGGDEDPLPAPVTPVRPARAVNDAASGSRRPARPRTSWPTGSTRGTGSTSIRTRSGACASSSRTTTP